jgi:Na+/H+ antiporter NhaA
MVNIQRHVLIYMNILPMGSVSTMYSCSVSSNVLLMMQKNQQTSMSSNSLILDVNVGVNYRNIHTPYSYTNWINPSILTLFISFIAVTTQL